MVVIFAAIGILASSIFVVFAIGLAIDTFVHWCRRQGLKRQKTYMAEFNNRQIKSITMALGIELNNNDKITAKDFLSVYVEELSNEEPKSISHILYDLNRSKNESI